MCSERTMNAQNSLLHTQSTHLHLMGELNSTVSGQQVQVIDFDAMHL